jgi:hypothetical protein
MSMTPEATGQDAYGRHQTRQPGEGHESRGRSAVVDQHVVRPRAAAVQPADHRQMMLMGMGQHAHHLGMIHRALRAGIDGVVVDHQVDRRAIDLAGAHDQTVGCAFHAVDRRPRQPAILDEAIGIDQPGNAFARRPALALALLFDRFRPRLIENGGAGVEHLLQIGAKLLFFVVFGHRLPAGKFRGRLRSSRYPRITP